MKLEVNDIEISSLDCLDDCKVEFTIVYKFS